MYRRRLVSAASGIAPSAPLAGGGGLAGETDETEGPATLARHAPAVTSTGARTAAVTGTDGKAIGLDRLVFRRGLVVSGPLVNTADRPLADPTVGARPYDGRRGESALSRQSRSPGVRGNVAVGGEIEEGAAFETDYGAVTGRTGT